MQNYNFYKNLANNNKNTKLVFDATIEFKKLNIVPTIVKQNWKLGSVKDNAINYLKNKENNTVCQIYNFVYIKYNNEVVVVNTTL